MGKVMFMKKGEKHITQFTEGTIWLFTEDGEFVVPATGTYELELHGGGGGGEGSYSYFDSSILATSSSSGDGGGGSGELFTTYLTAGEVLPVFIGRGGYGGKGYEIGPQAGENGGNTRIGSFSVAGGGGGNATGAYGAASGSLATAGGTASGNAIGAGGYGNSNNPAQTYGNGGAGGGLSTGTYEDGKDGQPGAAIVTYLGDRFCVTLHTQAEGTFWFQYEKGMTWREWIGSEYCPYIFYITDQYISVENTTTANYIGVRRYTSDTNYTYDPVSPDDIIDPSRIYCEVA